MEPTSPKGRDLRERRRFAMHNGVPDTEGSGGEFFLSGEGIAVDDDAVRAEVVAASSYEPAERYVLFELLVGSARANGYGDVTCLSRLAGRPAPEHSSSATSHPLGADRARRLTSPCETRHLMLTPRPRGTPSENTVTSRDDPGPGGPSHAPRASAVASRGQPPATPTTDGQRGVTLLRRGASASGRQPPVTRLRRRVSRRPNLQRDWKSARITRRRTVGLLTCSRPAAPNTCGVPTLASSQVIFWPGLATIG